MNSVGSDPVNFVIGGGFLKNASTDPAAPSSRSPRLRKILFQYIFKRFQQELCIRLIERHGWADFDDIMIRSIRAEQDAVLAHPVGDERSLLRGRLERGKILTSSTPRNNPAPLASATMRYFPTNDFNPLSSLVPTRAACACKPSFSRTSSTARPTAHETGLPPNVVKYSMPLSKASAISRRVTTAASG